MIGNKLSVAKSILILIALFSFGTVLGVIAYSTSLKKSSPIAIQSTVKPTPTPIISPVSSPKPQTSDKSYVAYFVNSTYTNLRYNFQITIPDEWNIGEYDDGRGGDPMFVFYKNFSDAKPSTELPADLMDNGTYVAVYPHGLGMEGVPGKTVPSTIKFNSDKQTVVDYVLENGSRWATWAYDFKNRPGSWNESGFIFGKNMISGKQEVCERDGKSIDKSQCDLSNGDTIIYSGTINVNDRKEVEKIISSFKFISS